ncbi:hypothetical protein DPMN_182169 [Dreissena polymorpha]|uniref:Uncharacterized protein n=1 Tax=Dreissena polymorpha TaxID=45954 RepID=A0A9D4DHK8_DREPO|nr:hypothetical protein DPMN_182169 [Dreissena polymorpha]
MGKYPSADEVMKLFEPTFSKKQEEKEIEELIIYHWNIFLKKVERKFVLNLFGYGLGHNLHLESTCGEGF